MISQRLFCSQNYISNFDIKVVLGKFICEDILQIKIYLKVLHKKCNHLIFIKHIVLDDNLCKQIKTLIHYIMYLTNYILLS